MIWIYSCLDYGFYDVAVSTTLVGMDLTLSDLLPVALWLLRSLLYCLRFGVDCERLFVR